MLWLPVRDTLAERRFAASIRRPFRGSSSVGRASRSQCEGRGFDPLLLHQSKPRIYGASFLESWRDPVRQTTLLILRRCNHAHCLWLARRLGFAERLWEFHSWDTMA